MGTPIGLGKLNAGAALETPNRVPRFDGENREKFLIQAAAKEYVSPLY